MNIDITTIVTALTSSALTAGAITYILKKSFDRTLELKIEQLKEKYKANIAESKRRNGHLFDRQSSAFSDLLRLVYRSRNSARDIVNKIEIPMNENLGKVNNNYMYFEQLKDDLDAFIQILYKERAIMPPLLFNVAHKMKNLLQEFLLQAKDFIYRSRQENINLELQNRTHKDIKNNYKEIDSIYSLITKEIQYRIGVEN